MPPSGWFLVARLDGVAVGCGALKIKGGGVGEIKRMWAALSVRGLDIAQRLLEALEAARRMTASRSCNSTRTTSSSRPAPSWQCRCRSQITLEPLPDRK